MSKKKTHSAELKFKVALEAVKGDKTIPQISQQYNVAPSLVHEWKKRLLESGASVYAGPVPVGTDKREQEREKAELYAKIGQLTVERDFLKKSLEG